MQANWSSMHVSSRNSELQWIHVSKPFLTVFIIFYCSKLSCFAFLTAYIVLIGSSAIGKVQIALTVKIQK